MPKRFPLSIKAKIRSAKKIFVFLDADYAHRPLNIVVSRAEALRLVDIAGPDHEPTGVVDLEGNLLLHPSEKPTA